MSAKRMTPEYVQCLPVGHVIWVAQNVDGNIYVDPMVTDGAGKIGNYYNGINCGLVDPGRFQFWSEKPTKKQVEECI